MKARGRYLIGIDFGDGTAPPMMLAVPLYENAPLWHGAEALSKEDFEKFLNEAERKAKDKDKDKGQGR